MQILDRTHQVHFESILSLMIKYHVLVSRWIRRNYQNKDIKLAIERVIGGEIAKRKNQFAMKKDENDKDWHFIGE